MGPTRGQWPGNEPVSESDCNAAEPQAEDAASR
jgi:hypothetical protein